MILQQLHRDADAIIRQAYGEHVTLPPTMYGLAEIAYVIEIDPEDDHADLLPVSRAQKKDDRRNFVSVPVLGRSSNVAPIALVDKPAYVLGITDGKTFSADAGGGKARDETTRVAFREEVRECWKATQLYLLLPVLRFLDRWDPKAPAFPIPSGLKSNDLIGFRIHGTPYPLVSDHPDVQAWWAARTRQDDARTMRCLVSNTDALIESKLPVLLKGVPGGNTSGAALSSFNDSSFESYGLGPYSAPISRDAGERFGKALNALLDSPRHHKVVGPFDAGVVYVWWLGSKPDAPDDGGAAAAAVRMPVFADSFTSADEEAAAVLAELGPDGEPNTDDLRALVESPRTGKPLSEQQLSDLKNSPFYLIGLSSHSGGRIVIRSVLDTTLRDLVRRQAEWFARTRIVDAFGQPARPVGIPGLLTSYVRDGDKKRLNQLTEALTQSVFADRPPPVSLLPAVTQRCRLGTSFNNGPREHVTSRRAALLKYLLTTYPNVTIEEDKMELEPLDQGSSEGKRFADAYRCGQIFAHLERIQYLALGKDVNATLVDRYFGGASTTPHTVLSRLLVQARQAHLPKIRKTRGVGSFLILQDELAEIAAPLGETLPTHLGQAEQGSFALGYYFQRAQGRKAAKSVGEPTPEESRIDSDSNNDDDTDSAEETE